MVRTRSHAQTPAAAPRAAPATHAVYLADDEYFPAALIEQPSIGGAGSVEQTVHNGGHYSESQQREQQRLKAEQGSQEGRVCGKGDQHVSRE